MRIIDRTSKRKGFTLLEIMIVVTIIGLLAAIGIPNFIRARKTTQRNTCINSLRILYDAAQELRLELPLATVNAANIQPYLGRQIGVVLNLEILVKELGGPGVVRKDAADFRSGDENKLGLRLHVEAVDGGGVEQIQFGVGAPDQVGETGALQFAPDGAADETAVAGDVDWGVEVTLHGAMISRGRGRGMTNVIVDCGGEGQGADTAELLGTFNIQHRTSNGSSHAFEGC